MELKYDKDIEELLLEISKQEGYLNRILDSLPTLQAPHTNTINRLNQEIDDLKQQINELRELQKPIEVGLVL